MNIKSPVLSPRLQKIADQIRPCRCVADIGTDHAYLPVWLCLHDRCLTAIASDLRPGPLSRAAATVQEYSLEKRIDLRLGSGADPLSPDEADTIVLAGMGGLLMAELLQNRPQVFASAKQILLQPMSAIPELREALYRMDYRISDEILILEEDKLYHLLSVVPEPEKALLSKEDFFLGHRLAETRPAHFEEYLSRQRRRLEEKLAGLKKARTIDETAVLEVLGLLRRIQTLEGDATLC